MLAPSSACDSNISSIEYLVAKFLLLQKQVHFRFALKYIANQ